MKPSSLKVEIPSAEQDRPAWRLVAVIAAAGFIVGVAWPKLLGVRVGPRAPDENVPKTAVTAPADPKGTHDVPAVIAVPNGPSSAAASASATAAATKVPEKKEIVVTVARGVVLSCKSADGEQKKNKECGSLTGLDTLVAPKVRRLASCPAAEGVSGKLTVIAQVDFANQKVTLNRGKATIENADTVMGCLRQGSVPFTGLDHDGEFTSYTLAFSASFVPKESTSEAMSREATLSVDGVLVRETPKTGKVLAKLSRGTPVKVLESKDGWYRVQFGDSSTEGWIWRSALGR